MLTVTDLAVRYGTLAIVKGVSFTVQPGQWLMIVGPNGAGKSTLLSAIAQNTAYTGQVHWNGTDVKKRKKRELARDMGVLLQNHAVEYAFSVEEVVRLGRYAYREGPFGKKDTGEEQAVERALTQTGLQQQRGQSVLTLSGGELQRTFLAQVLAQDPRLLLLDEPTNHLDLVYQKQIFELIRIWLQEEGRAVVSVVHDLSLARVYGTDALLMDRGRAAAQGRIEQVLTEEYLEQVYGMDVYDWMRKMYGQWQTDGE